MDHIQPQIEQCCLFVLSAINGERGALSEVIALSLFVLIFSILAGWLLKKLAHHFEKSKHYWEEGFVKALFLPLNYYVWFFVLLYSIDLTAKNFFDTTIFTNMSLWLNIGLIFAIVWFLLRWKNNIMNIMVRKSKNHEISVDRGRLDVIDKVLTIGLIFVAFLMLLEVTHSSVNTLIAFGGIGGLALAFASQEIIANFFSGAMIYLTRPFLVGDLINVPEKGIEGYVEEIGWYMTRIRTRDKRPIYIPNSIFSKIVVINPSRMTYRQFKENFSFRIEDLPRIDAFIKNTKAMLETSPDIDQRQKIEVYLNALGADSLDVMVSGFTKTTVSHEFNELRQHLLLQVYEQIEKNGLKIAPPVTYIEMAKPFKC